MSNRMQEKCLLGNQFISTELYLFSFFVIVFSKMFYSFTTKLVFPAGYGPWVCVISGADVCIVKYGVVGVWKKKKRKRKCLHLLCFSGFSLNLPQTKNSFDISDLLQSKIRKKCSHMRMSQWWQRVSEVLKTRRHSCLTLWGIATWSNFYGKQFWTIWNPEICISCIVSLG